MNDLTKLREIANAATPGPWERGMTTFGDPREGATHACVRVEGAHWTDHLVVSDGCDEADRDMAHIAAFDPPTVLALIDRLEAAEAKVERVEALVEKEPGRSEGEIKAEALREFADTRGVNVGVKDDDWWRGYRQAQHECLQDALKAADQVADTEGSE